MKRYDVYRVTSPDYEEPWFSGGQVVVYESHRDEETARKRTTELNDARDAYDRKFVVFQVREKEMRTRYHVCKFPSIYDEDRWTGTDAVCHEPGYEDRKTAEKRAQELNRETDPSDPNSAVFQVFERTN